METPVSKSPGVAQYGCMANQKGAPGLVVRVLQGVILGAVLAVPVVLWGLSRVEGTLPEVPVDPSAAAHPKASAKRGKPMMRRPVPVKAREAETIPAARMHIRIDDGSRPPAAAAAPAAPKEDIE